jgi:hypothetical protein
LLKTGLFILSGEVKTTFALFFSAQLVQKNFFSFDLYLYSAKFPNLLCICEDNIIRMPDKRWRGVLKKPGRIFSRRRV